jgi:hypothetical protein
MPPSVPPFPLRSRTQEIDALKTSFEGALSDFQTHLKGVSLELAAERDARQKEKRQGISILNIHVPLAVVLGLFGTLTIAAVAGGSYYHETKTHITDTVIHADRTKSLAGGGPVFAKDLKDAIVGEASDRDAYIRRVERAVTRGAQCRPSKVRGEFVCSFQDPETLKLRPP